MSKEVTVDLIKCDGGTPYGCLVSDGGLVPFLAPVKLSPDTPANAVFATYSAGTGRFFLCTPQQVFSSGNGITFAELGAYGGVNAFLIEDISDGAARGIIVRGGIAVAHTGTSYRGFSYGVKLSCGAMHCGRLFGADADDPLLVRWSGKGGITDWEEGLNASGSVTLDPERGGILGLIGLGEYLVAVREYGLSILSMFGNTENFAVAITDTDADGILKGTACAVGGKLYFLTRSGLHVYDGSRIARIATPFDGRLSEPKGAVEYGGKYFLCCKADGDGAVFCYDAESGRSSLIRAQGSAVLAADKVYLYGADGAFALERGGKFSYVCGKADFGSGRIKTLKRLYIDGVADIEVSNGRLTRKIAGACGSVKVGMRGRAFTVKVEGENPVQKLTATAEAYDAI